MAGVIVRPITQPNTWAIGASAEAFTASNLDSAAIQNNKGFLTSNGPISQFVENLITKMDCIRERSGGAGNKALLLLEGRGEAYIQDRGVSRWDTCAAQAVLEAHGGTLSKLSAFQRNRSLRSYHYIGKSIQNADFEPGVARYTRFNLAKDWEGRGVVGTLAQEPDSVKPYANLCGLLALRHVNSEQLNRVADAVDVVAASSPPVYD